MNSYDLGPVRVAIMSVYREIVKICEKHHLRQWVFFGTLLGAARHHGFIPWDDDIDIAMPRKDYNEFIRLAQRELPDWLEWHSSETDSAHKLTFGKVIDNRINEIKAIQNMSCLKLEQGIFVDVFPLDGLPSNDLALFFWKVQRSIRRRLKMTPNSLQRWHKKRDFDNANRVGFAEETVPRKCRFQYKLDYFKETIYLPFEDGVVAAPKGWEHILELMFGDWRKLPPEDKRVPNHQSVNL